MSDRGSSLKTRLLPIAAVGGAAAAVAIETPWYRHWGATVDEVRMPLPGDDLIRYPHASITEAITVRSAPHEVWPLLRHRRRGFELLRSEEGTSLLHASTQDLAEDRPLRFDDLKPQRYMDVSIVTSVEAAPGGTRIRIRTRVMVMPEWQFLRVVTLVRPALFYSGRRELLAIRKRCTPSSHRGR